VITTLKDINLTNNSIGEFGIGEIAAVEKYRKDIINNTLLCCKHYSVALYHGMSLYYKKNTCCRLSYKV